MKKVLILFFVAAMAASLVTCKKEPEAGKLESITFKEATYTVQENYNDLNLRKQLVGTPAGVIETCKITWEVSDLTIAEVENGWLLPKSPGVVTVTATAQDKKASCKITITEVPITGATLENLSVGINSTNKLAITTEPEGISITRFTLKSLDTSIATVDSDGTVHGIKEGTVKITATHDDITAECTVTVKKVVVSKIKIEPTEYRFYEPNKTFQLNATIEPEDASFPEITWSSSKPEVVKVDKNGTITAVKYDESSVTITAKADGVTGSCSVKVYPQQSKKITLDRGSYTFSKIGDTFTLKITDIQPEARTLTDKFKWSTSNKNLAVVNGVEYVEGNILSVTVKCLAAGSTSIRCTDTWSNVYAVCSVELPVIPVKSISLNTELINLYSESSTSKLTATIYPSNSTTTSVSWSSDNTGVATVNENGVVSVGNSSGMAIITAKADYKTAQCTVIVKLKDNIKDYENNTYTVVKISGRWWMAEDLKSTKTSSGGKIDKDELGINAQAGYTTRTPNSTNVKQYYYNRKAANIICPSGYSLPTAKEWEQLTQNVTGTTKWQALKSTTGWATSGLNQLFFDAKPVGYVNVSSMAPSSSTKELISDGTGVMYWSTTGAYEITNTNARTTTWNPETHAFNVRCIKNK